VDWLARLEPSAPDVVAAYRSIEVEQPDTVRVSIRERAGAGSTGRIVRELQAIARALADLVGGLPDEAFAMPGGEGDWNVAQALGHDIHARSGLVLAASLAAADRWPAKARPVVPGVPGAPDADRDDLLRRLDRSQDVIARAARSIAGHETDPCPLDHPLVGRLRCGEWLLFAGVHDLMHLEQLHELAASPGANRNRRGRSPSA
jgi:hypothetical protein